MTTLKLKGGPERFLAAAVLLLSITVRGSNPRTPSYEPIPFEGSLLKSYGCGNRTSPAVTCSRKCCDRDYVLLKDGMCVYEPKGTHFNVPVFEGGRKSTSDALGMRFVPGHVGCDYDYGYYNLPNRKNFVSLHADGRFSDNENGIVYDYGDFCIEYLEGEGIVSIICTSRDEVGLFQDLSVAEQINIIGEVISLPFLLATFVIYAILPERNLHAKALMCYVFALFMAFATTVITFFVAFQMESCIVLVVVCVFFYMASFCWMNVMSFDIWWTFSGKSGFNSSRSRSERKRFLLYSAYGWGIPLVLAAIIAFLSFLFVAEEGAWFHPGIGEYLECWFKDEIRELLYYYGPMGITTMINIVFFVVTTIKIRRIQQETVILQRQDSRRHGQEDDKYWFCMFLKLLLIMGLNWTMDLIAWGVDWMINNVPPAVWYLSDLCNALYGVLIFFLFCFNKKTWNQLKRRYYKCRGLPEPKSTTNTSTSRSVDDSRLLRTNKTGTT